MRNGVAVYDDKTGKWNTRHVHVTAELTTVTESIPGSGSTDENGQRIFQSAERPDFFARWRLSDRKQVDAARERAVVGLGLQIRPVEPGSEFTSVSSETVFEPHAFVSLIRSVPVAHFDSVWTNDELDVERALSHPRLTPIVVATIHDDSERVSWDRRTVAALGWIGDTAYRGLLQRLAEDSVLDDPSLAFARARLGDSSGVVTLRRWTVTGLSGFGKEEIIERLVELGDPLTTAELARSAYEGGDPHSYFLLRRAATRTQWRQAMADAARSPSAASALINSIAGVPIDSVAPDNESRMILRRLAVIAFTAPTDASSSYSEQVATNYAADLMLTLGDPAVIPSLISVLTGPRYLRAMTTLIQLTGIDSASFPPNANADEKLRVQKFWSLWWQQHERGFTPASRAMGSAALRRWREAWLR
jgi:hypothetical protein